MMQRTANENVIWSRRICKRSDQPKIERIANNMMQGWHYVESLTGQRHVRVQTESQELQTAVHGCNSWLSLWTLSCRCPVKLSTYCQPCIMTIVCYFFRHLTHWLLELLRKWRFLDIFVVFRLDLGQISFDLAKNVRASRQLGFLATGIAFYDFLTRACADIKNFD